MDKIYFCNYCSKVFKNEPYGVDLFPFEDYVNFCSKNCLIQHFNITEEIFNEYFNKYINERE